MHQGTTARRTFPEGTMNPFQWYLVAALPVLFSIVFLSCYDVGEVRALDPTLPPNSMELRSRLMKANVLMSNTLHKRFKKSQKIIMYVEDDIDSNILFNPMEISIIQTLLMIGMEDNTSYLEMMDFMGFMNPKVYFTYPEMFKAVQQYIYNEEYRVWGEWNRKIHLSTNLFTNNFFDVIPEFKESARRLFKTEIQDLWDYTNTTQNEMIQAFVKNKTHDFIGPLPRLTDNFLAMFTATTYIQDFFLYPSEPPADDPLVLVCTMNNEQFKLQTTTKLMATWHVDQSDRYGVMIPFTDGTMSLYFFVPKTEELFMNMDQNMSYYHIKQMVDDLLGSTLTPLRVTFPLVEMSYSRNLTLDMQINGVHRIFTANGTGYANMTIFHNLYVTEIYHESFIKMTSDRVDFTSITDMPMLEGEPEPTKEYPFIEFTPSLHTIDFAEELSDFLHKKFNNAPYWKKTVGRKKIFSEKPYVTNKTSPGKQIYDILKGKFSTAYKKRDMKLKPKRLKSKNCRKTKKRRTPRNNKSYRAIAAPPYFEPTSTLSLSSKAMHHDFLDESQTATESVQSCLNNESSSCTNSKIGYYTPDYSTRITLPPAGTEVYEMESSRKLEMNRKRIPAGETLLSYGSKSNHRQKKALWPGDTSTKWGFFRPRGTYTVLGTTTPRYVFTTPKPESVAIKNSFFFGIVNHETKALFFFGKVSHCKAEE